jgi:hypothetical protein
MLSLSPQMDPDPAASKKAPQIKLSWMRWEGGWIGMVQK